MPHNKPGYAKDAPPKGVQVQSRSGDRLCFLVKRRGCLTKLALASAGLVFGTGAGTLVAACVWVLAGYAPSSEASRALLALIAAAASTTAIALGLIAYSLVLIFGRISVELLPDQLVVKSKSIVANRSNRYSRRDITAVERHQWVGDGTTVEIYDVAVTVNDQRIVILWRVDSRISQWVGAQLSDWAGVEYLQT